MGMAGAVCYPVDLACRFLSRHDLGTRLPVLADP